MANLTIEERLLHYFLAMGAQSADPLPNSPPGLSLVIGQERVHVVVLNNDSLAQRNRIVDAIMSLSSLRGSVNQIYLAASKLLGTAIDASIFRAHGIGLLLFDDRRIDEAVPAQTTRSQEAVAAVQGSDHDLAIELQALKSKYHDMELTIAKLREDLHGLRNANTSPPLPKDGPRIIEPQRLYTGSSSELPSYFVNNPWLEVLSKRGREENGPLAG